MNVHELIETDRAIKEIVRRAKDAASQMIVALGEVRTDRTLRDTDVERLTLILGRLIGLRDLVDERMKERTALRSAAEQT